MPKSWKVHKATTTRKGFDIQTANGKKLIAYNVKSKAHADLIAAAPGLLDALIVAKAVIDKDIDLTHEDYDFIDAAITKAKGGA